MEVKAHLLGRKEQFGSCHCTLDDSACVWNVKQGGFQEELMHLLMENCIISKPDRSEIRKWAIVKK